MSILFIAMFYVGFLLLFRRPMRRELRKQLVLRGVPVCVECGYDLRGAKDRCPECGTAISMHVSVTLNPVERFSRLCFPGLSERFFPEDPPVDLIDYTTYECDRCSKQIRLDLHNFQNAVVQPVTNLSQDADQKMTEAFGRTRSYIRRWFPRLVRKTGLGRDSYLDWYCPGCGRAVRVYYSAAAGGRGEFFVEILKLLESS